jgi:excisionase family DNA binding protein
MTVTNETGPAAEEFLRPAEAAKLLHVSPQTISRWAKEGRIAYVVTLGGHRRFRATEVERLARGGMSSTDA